MLEWLDISDARWQELLINQKNSGIFHTSAWSNLIQETYHFRSQLLGSISPNGELSAGLPIMEKRTMSGKVCWVSLPFSDHCVPLSLDVEGEENFNLQLDLFIQQNTDKTIELRSGFPSLDRLAKKDGYVLHTIPLSSEFQQNYRLIHPSSRRNVRTAIKNQLRIEIHTDLDHLREFYHLHLLTRHRQGVPIQPWEFFKNLASGILANNSGFVVSAYYDSHCLASAIFLIFKKTITYKYGASNPVSLHLRPNDLIFHEIIRWGCEHGYNSIDLGRTDMNNTGLRHYKSCWGSVEQPLIYSFSPTALPERPDWMMSSLNKIIRNSPLWVCRFIGELFYRYAG